jgi:nitrite reductase/ring-hydroxylating ferredoxin subunit
VIDRLPAQAYRDEALLARERAQLLHPAWQVLGHEAELRTAGDYLSGDAAGAPALVVRAERGRLYAFRNACRHRPHALVSARRGHLKSAFHCAAHGLTYSFDGRLVSGPTPGDLAPLQLRRAGRVLLVRPPGGAPETSAGVEDSAWAAFARLTPQGVSEREVAADWKLLVEQWLETALPQQRFIAPNQLLEVRTDGARILQVVPVAAGRSRLRRFEFSRERAAPRARRARTERQAAAWLTGQIALAESTQAGLGAMPETAPEGGPIPPALARLRAQIAALLPAPERESGGH